MAVPDRHRVTLVEEANATARGMEEQASQLSQAVAAFQVRDEDAAAHPRPRLMAAPAAS